MKNLELKFHDIEANISFHIDNKEYSNIEEYRREWSIDKTPKKIWVNAVESFCLPNGVELLYSEDYNNSFIIEYNLETGKVVNQTAIYFNKILKLVQRSEFLNND